MTNLLNALAQVVQLLLAEPVARTSSLDGDPIDIQDYEGVGVFALNAALATAGTTPTLNCKLQHCDTEDGTYADVTNGAFEEVTDEAGNGVQVLKLNVSNLKRYVKLIGTIAGASASFDFSSEFLGVKKIS